MWPVVVSHGERDRGVAATDLESACIDRLLAQLWFSGRQKNPTGGNRQLVDSGKTDAAVQDGCGIKAYLAEQPVVYRSHHSEHPPSVGPYMVEQADPVAVEPAHAFELHPHQLFEATVGHAGRSRRPPSSLNRRRSSTGRYIRPLADILGQIAEECWSSERPVRNTGPARMPVGRRSPRCEYTPGRRPWRPDGNTRPNRQRSRTTGRPGPFARPGSPLVDTRKGC